MECEKCRKSLESCNKKFNWGN